VVEAAGSSSGLVVAYWVGVVVFWGGGLQLFCGEKDFWDLFGLVLVIVQQLCILLLSE
jgi:hypothetical protein